MIKTAVSLQESLFEQVEALAQALKIPRSRLFALALEEYVRRYQNRQLLEQINQAYQDEPDESEQTRLHAMSRQQRKIVEGGW